MFIAHLPGGYLLSRIHPALTRHRHWVMAGAVLPDLDMLVFHLWDHGTVHHHTYLTHRPALWLAVLAGALLCRHMRFGRGLAALGLGAVLHMMLDSVVGQIGWGWPITSHAFALVEVPATQDWWVLSFVLHWSFLAELILCAAALWVWQRGRPTGSA